VGVIGFLLRGSGSNHRCHHPGAEHRRPSPCLLRPLGTSPLL